MPLPGVRETLLGYLEKDPSQSTGFKMPVINSKDKWRKFCWDGFVCCLLTGGPAVDALMASRSKYMDSSFAKRMGLGLSSVLEVNEGEFKKLVSDAFRRFDEDGSGTRASRDFGGVQDAPAGVRLGG